MCVFYGDVRAMIGLLKRPFFLGGMMLLLQLVRAERPVGVQLFLLGKAAKIKNIAWCYSF